MMTVAELQAAKDFAAELQSDTIAIELNRPTLGRRRSMTERVKCEIAEHYGAKRKSVGATKSLYAPNQSEIKKIGTVLGSLKAAWEDMTIKYRKGVRLLRKDRLDEWIAVFEKHEEALTAACLEADEHYEEILQASKEYVGEQLFDRNEYPNRFTGWLHCNWGVQNFEPSDELLKLAPATYEREQQRARERFELAVVAYEEEARLQLHKLVTSLLDKLNEAKAGKNKDGKAVKYTEAATSNLREFFERFDKLGIRSDESLNELVDDAKKALGSTTMYDVKKSESKRDTLADSFSAVSAKLATLIVEAPSRSIELDDLDD